MAKRSPILGYNHNVRYRGLVFHVQTEDSGVLSPHLFTHLFHGGVIVSTRKLVYDSGANEEAIKSLMQAQHKAVLKDLRKGSFDDKIDEYLGSTPGLEPRVDATVANERPSEPTLDVVDQTVPMEMEPPTPPLETPAASAPSLPIATLADIDPPTERASLTAEAPVAPRSITSERANPPSVRFRPSHEDAAAVQQIAPQTSITIRTPSPSRTVTPQQQGRALTPPQPRSPAPTPPVASPTPPRAPAPSRPPPVSSVPGMQPLSLGTPAIADFASLGDDEPRRARQPHDTDIEMPALGSSDGVPQAPPPDPIAPPTNRSRTGDRPALGAAALPPQRPISRPSSRPSVTPPAVVARPLVDAEGKPRNDTGAIEIYAPAPASVEPPPGEQRADRRVAGEYSVSKKRPTGEAVPLSERTGRIAVPSGLGRPGRASSAPTPVPVAPRKEATTPPPLPIRKEATTPPPMPRVTKPHGTVESGPPSRPTAPLPQARSGASNQPVVMTRPAVIVGAPPKQAAAAGGQRVRKAREEDRGFGHGLISEKSLDEVILAYLSEDADDK